MGLLDGKVALVTGGARGQGRAHAVACAREGANVVLVDIDTQIASVVYPTASAEDLATTVHLVEALERRAIGVTADVRSQEQLDSAVELAVNEFGQLDILIANAGIWARSPFWELSEPAWAEMIDINLTGVWRSAKAVAPHMIDRRTGSIVITSSISGLRAGSKDAHYVASKHGVIGLMKTMALELAPFGIRCNAIIPGATNTPMTNHQEAWNMFAGYPGADQSSMIEAGYRFHALSGRSFLPPEAIADTALYLNSELAASVTGVTIPVDAGHLLLHGVNDTPTSVT